MKIVHVIPKSVFIAFTASVFEEAAPGSNTFLVLGSESEGAAYTVPAGVRREWIGRDDAGAERIGKEVATSDIAVFHNVGGYTARILAAAPANVVTVWSGWGGDYYGTNANPSAGLLGPLTRRYMARRTPWPLRLPRRAYAAYRSLKNNRPVRDAARAVDVFSAPIPEDLDVFTRRFREFRGRYAQLNYASVEDTYARSSRTVAGEKILVGNSADPANNHLDVLDSLRRLHTPGREIVVPLSYGKRAYADAVSAEGKRLFGADFVALREFLPLDEYSDIIAQCGVVVMGHRRQQAIGNVATALWGGAHVLMDARNPLYSFLRSRGATVGTLQDATHLPTGRVSDEERESNVRMLNEFWARSVVVDNIRALVDAVALRDDPGANSHRRRP